MCKRLLVLLTCLILSGSGASLVRAEFQDLGIRIKTPAAGQRFYTTEPMAVVYRITAENTGTSIVDFSLIHAETFRPVARKTHRLPPAGKGSSSRRLSLEHRFSWILPDVEEGRYYLLATMGSLVGNSHEFEIKVRPVINRTQGRTIGPGTAPSIVIHRPSAGETIRHGSTIDIEWTMPGAMSAFACGNVVNISFVRLSDGHERVAGRRVSTTPGRNIITMTFDRVFSPGHYRLMIISDAGCNAQTDFNLVATDLGLESVSFSDGRTLESGINTGTGQYVTGTFSVAVRWNRIGNPWRNKLKVRSVLTGTYINNPTTGTAISNESMRSDGLINVRLPFRFERDAVSAMMTGTRRIPLEFSIHTSGGGLDMDETNNTLRAEMRILGTTETDVAIRAVLRDFNLRRRASAAPLTEYRFTQQFRITNLSRNEAGGPPSPRNVTVRWQIQYRNPDHGEWFVLRSGNTVVSNVPGGTWKNASCSGAFSENLPDDIPSGRQFRLLLKADPAHALMDPNRGNNEAIVGFRIVD